MKCNHERGRAEHNYQIVVSVVEDAGILEFCGLLALPSTSWCV